VLQKKYHHAVYIVQWTRIPFINLSGYNAIKHLINVGFQKVNVLSSSFIINRKFRKRWSTIPPISTNLTITSQLIEHKKTMSYDIGNPGPGTKMWLG
jgi:hypothetical protein